MRRAIKKQSNYIACCLKARRKIQIDYFKKTHDKFVEVCLVISRPSLVARPYDGGMRRVMAQVCTHQTEMFLPPKAAKTLMAVITFFLQYSIH